MYPLRASGLGDFTTGVQIRATGEVYPLASTQGEQTMDTPTGTRPLVRAASLAEYKKEPEFAKEEEPEPELTLYPGQKEFD